MERGIEVAKGRCRIGIDPFDAVALEKSVGLEVDGAEAFGNVGFFLAAECRKKVGGKFAFQMQLVNASVDPVDDAFFRCMKAWACMLMRLFSSSRWMVLIFTASGLMSNFAERLKA